MYHLKKVKLENIVIIILVLLNVVVVYNYNNFKQDFSYENNLKTKVFQLTKSSLQHHIKYYSVSIEKSILDSIGLYKKNNSNVLLYRFFRSNCDPCLMNDLEEIKSYMTKVKDINILIFHYIPRSRHEKIYLNSILSEFNHIAIPDSILNMGHDNGSKNQFFGIIDTTKQIKSIYFPLKESPFITKQYLEDISMVFN